MRTRLLLVGAPVALIVLMAQAALWVPSYDRQANASPDRLRKFVDAGIGDAKILNPILSADSASSRITGLVFEGLLEYDDELQLTGLLASSWRLSETLVIAALDYGQLADGQRASAEALSHSLRAFVEADPNRMSRFIEMRTRPGETRTLRVDDSGAIVEDEAPQSADEPSAGAAPSNGKESDDNAAKAQAPTTVEVVVPPTIELEFTDVEPESRVQLEAWLGDGYAQQFAAARHLRGAEPLSDRARESLLATQVEVIGHRPRVVFELHEGVRFHDGHELNAYDVRFTYEAIMNPKNLSPRTSDFEPIASVEVLSKYRVAVNYKRLFSPAVSVWVMPLLPEHLLNDERMAAEIESRGLSPTAAERFGMRDVLFNRNPVGTGPFRFIKWSSDELIELAAHETHWRGRPEYDAYYMRVIPDKLTQEVEFRAGAIDQYIPEPHQAERYANDTNFRALSGTGLAYSYIGYNLRREPFSDPRVRRALAMALNVPELIEHVLYGQGERITGPYAVSTQWYDPSVPAISYDPAGALELLSEAGWKRNAGGWLEKDGKELAFNLITNNGNEQRKTIASVAQNAWRRIGVKCTTQLFEWTVFLEDFVNKNEFDAVVLGWGLTPEPDLYQLFHSSQTAPRQLNFAGYVSDEADELIERIRITYDPSRLQDLTRQLHRKIADDQPYTFLYAPRSTLVLDRKIVQLDADGKPGAPSLTKAASPYPHLHRWVKLEHRPAF